MALVAKGCQPLAKVNCFSSKEKKQTGVVKSCILIVNVFPDQLTLGIFRKEYGEVNNLSFPYQSEQ